MKILIIGSEAAAHKAARYDVAKELQKLNDDLVIAPMFTTDIMYEHSINEDSIYYMTAEEVELSYKNGAFMWVMSEESHSTGVTKADMYNNNIFTVSFHEFNNMSDAIFNELNNDDMIIVFMDSSDVTMSDKSESSYSCERIFQSPYLYFLDEDNDIIVKTVLDYITSTSKHRQDIIDSLL